MPARAAATKQPASIAASASTHPQTSSFVSATGCVQFFNRSGHAQRRTPSSARLVQEQLEDRSSLRMEWSSRSRSATLSTAFGPTHLASSQAEECSECWQPCESTATSRSSSFQPCSTAWSGARASLINTEHGLRIHISLVAESMIRVLAAVHEHSHFSVVSFQPFRHSMEWSSSSVL